MNLYPGDPSPANAPTPPGSLPASPALIAAPQSPLVKLWRPIEQRLGLEGSILLLLALAAAGIGGVVWLFYKLSRP